LTLYREEKYRELAEAILDDEGYLPSLLNARSYGVFNREIAVQHLIEELKKHKDAPNPVGAFYFWNRTRREIALAPFSILGQGTKVLMPYLEPTLFDFLSAVPGEDLLDKKFHTETITFAYPKYAHIPYEEKTAAPNLDYKHFRRFNADIVRYAFSVKGEKLVRRDFLISRLLRSLVDKNYSESVIWYSPLAIYLLQMEELWQG
jgi:asparagine synthase (glutamine-hydrolysing)